jgi:hypothetical protein
MARKDLLSEAIADAKAVKETAMANAKLALEEAFTPKLQSMISAKLAEEADEEEEMEEELDSSDVGTGDNAESSADDSSEIENDDDLTEEEDEEETDEGYHEGEDEDEMEEGYHEGEDEDMEETYEGEDMDEEEDEDDLDLESVIAELEAEMDDEEDMEMDSEEDMEDEMEVEEDEDEEEIDLDEVIKTLKEMSEEEEDEEEVNEEEDEDLSGELEEAYKTIESLKSTINEVNLMNAKLLYVNKLFRTFDLNEGQKVKVLENFDRTSSVREVKLVFSTLAENLNVAKKKKSVVKEGYASKATKSSAPKKEIISEGNDMAARWKKLAGLK